MTFAEAIKQGIPLQVVLPNRRRPFELERRNVAEIFLAETRLGAAVIWLEPYWCEMPIEKACRISYADPLETTAESPLGRSGAALWSPLHRLSETLSRGATDQRLTGLERVFGLVDPARRQGPGLRPRGRLEADRSRARGNRHGPLGLSVGPNPIATALTHGRIGLDSGARID
jgi:hypothetical protein